MALSPIMAARERYGADQVLFAPGGQLQETGASNIVLIDGDHLLTPALTDAYLHGVTRDSLLRLARHRGWTVEEREVSLDELRRVDRPAPRRAGAHRHGRRRRPGRHARRRRRRRCRSVRPGRVAAHGASCAPP